MATYYEVLGVSHSASTEEIKKAYKVAALKAHPDKGGSTAEMQRVNEAYTVLKHRDSRKAYDATLPTKGKVKSSSRRSSSRAPASSSSSRAPPPPPPSSSSRAGPSYESGQHSYSDDSTYGSYYSFPESNERARRESRDPSPSPRGPRPYERSSPPPPSARGPPPRAYAPPPQSGSRSSNHESRPSTYSRSGSRRSQQEPPRSTPIFTSPDYGAQHGPLPRRTPSMASPRDNRPSSSSRYEFAAAEDVNDYDRPSPRRHRWQHLGSERSDSTHPSEPRTPRPSHSQAPRSAPRSSYSQTPGSSYSQAPSTRSYASWSQGTSFGAPRRESISETWTPARAPSSAYPGYMDSETSTPRRRERTPSPPRYRANSVIPPRQDYFPAAASYITPPRSGAGRHSTTSAFDFSEIRRTLPIPYAEDEHARYSFTPPASGRRMASHFDRQDSRNRYPSQRRGDEFDEDEDEEDIYGA